MEHSTYIAGPRALPRIEIGSSYIGLCVVRRGDLDLWPLRTKLCCQLLTYTLLQRKVYYNIVSTATQTSSVRTELW